MFAEMGFTAAKLEDKVVRFFDEQFAHLPDLFQWFCLLAGISDIVLPWTSFTVLSPHMTNRYQKNAGIAFVNYCILSID